MRSASIKIRTEMLYGIFAAGAAEDWQQYYTPPMRPGYATLCVQPFWEFFSRYYHGASTTDHAERSEQAHGQDGTAWCTSSCCAYSETSAQTKGEGEATATTQPTPSSLVLPAGGCTSTGADLRG